MQPRGDRPLIISFRIEHLLGWAITLFLCAVPVYLWAQINPLPQINNFSAVMINLGRVTGLIGMVMYALNLVYATRLRFLEYLFGGLNRVYIAHHILGGFALIFLSLHPLFLALRLVKISLLEVTLFMLPNGLTPLGALFDTASGFHAQVLQQWALFFGIIAFWGMVGLLLITFFIQVPYRFWLFTHRYLGWFFAIGGLHVLFITSDTSISPTMRTYMLAITALGVLAFFYRLLAGKIVVRHYKYVVRDISTPAPGVFEFNLRPDEALRMNYKPGQFIFIRFFGAKGISHEWHPFSISSSPDELDLTVTIKGLGDYTRKLGNIVPGVKAEIEGAYGMFSYTNYKNPNQIWIAGGIGVTPFISMAKSLPLGQYNIDLYYTVRTASEVINWPVMVDLANRHQGRFRVIPYISDQQTGHLTADYIESISGPVAGREIYICGPAMMMKSLRKQFKDKSVPGTSIHTEEFAMS